MRLALLLLVLQKKEQRGNRDNFDGFGGFGGYGGFGGDDCPLKRKPPFFDILIDSLRLKYTIPR